MAQEVGFSLREIHELLNMGETKNISKNDLKKVAEEKIMNIDERIKALKTMRKVLVDLSERALTMTKKIPIVLSFLNLKIWSCDEKAVFSIGFIVGLRFFRKGFFF